MTTFHMKQSIAGCLRNNPIGTIDFLEDEDGRPLSDKEARIELNKLLEQGHTVMPVGTDCEGFDVFGGGCPGHEPLTGSDLARAYFKAGGKQHICYAGDDGDESTNDLNIELITHFCSIDGFVSSRYDTYSCALLIDSHGDELTAKDIGL